MISLTSICKNDYTFYKTFTKDPEKLVTPKFEKKALLQCLYAAGLFFDNKFRETAEVLSVVPYTKYEEELRQIMSPSDFAYYTVINALATFSRSALKKINNNQMLKAILETIPELNGIIGLFLDSNYKEVFGRLNIISNMKLLDPIFVEKSKSLFRLITERSIIHYCMPYQSVDLIVMAESLGQDLRILESNLVSMTTSGLVKAMIDSKNKVLYLENKNEKTNCYKMVLENGKKFIQEAREILLMMKLNKEKLILESKISPFDRGGFDMNIGALGIRKFISTNVHGTRMDIDSDSDD